MRFGRRCIESKRIKSLHWAQQLCDGPPDDAFFRPSLSFVAQLASTVKTVEILGQVLKNQYAVISRPSRVDMLQQLMRGPLRGIRALLDLFLDSRDIIISELEDILEKKVHISDEKRRSDLARRVLAQMLQTAAFGFIQRTATSISSRELVDDIHTATKAIGTPAARLIELAVRLDNPDALPRDLMKKLNDDVRADIVGGTIVQQLALQRLYMFKVTFEDKQWLASQKIVGLQQQGAVSYRARRTKKLK